MHEQCCRMQIVGQTCCRIAMKQINEAEIQEKRNESKVGGRFDWRGEESTEVNKHENYICTDVDDEPVPSRWKKTNFAV